MPSDFRLYLHIQTGSADQDHAAWSALGYAPAWSKVFGANHCREVKAASPTTKTLLRYHDLSESDGYLASYTTGQQFVLDAKARSGGSFAGVDALEFMNERTTFEDIYQLQRNNTAALGFIAQCQAEGIAPVVHNAAFANPRPDLMRYLAPSISAAIAANGYFGLHCYGPANLFDASSYYVECYIAQLEALRAAGVIVPPSRVLITEFGHDVVSSYSGRSGAWKDLGLPITQIMAEYIEYDRRLRERGIAGAFMYNIFGYPDDPYELWPNLRDWYSDRLREHNVPAPPPPPPPPSPEFPKSVYARIDGPGPYVNLRDGSGIDIADVPRGTRLTATGRDTLNRLVIDARVAEYVTQVNDPGPYRMPLWLWPVGDTAEECYTSLFWEYRGGTYYHEGVDIRARNRRPILAVTDGVIVRASLWNGTLIRWDNYGHHVVLMVDDTDYSVLFAHMSELRVSTGQRVTRGTVLGYSGSSGNTGGAEHLHLHCCHPTGRVAVFNQLVIDPVPLFPVRPHC